MAPVAAVVRLAAASRALVLLLSLLSRTLFRSYDTSASLHPTCLSPSLSTSATNSSAASVSSLAVWDSVHFVRAAECGYEYEQSLALLPLLPASLALLSRSLFAPLVPVLGYRAVLVVSGYVLNNAAFVAAAAYFYRLCYKHMMLLSRKKGSCWQCRTSSLDFCAPFLYFYHSLLSKRLDISTYA